MHKIRDCCWPVLLWWLSSPALRIAFGLNATRTNQRQPPCQPGKVHSVLAVRHGNIRIPFETKSILYMLFACIVILNFFDRCSMTTALRKWKGCMWMFFCTLHKGHYCPEGSEIAVPCPRGTFAPSFWARDINGCISCPPHHYAPTEGLSACLPCGSRARQPLPRQDKCICLTEGQVFQVSTRFYVFIFGVCNCMQTDQQYPVVQSVAFS